MQNSDKVNQDKIFVAESQLFVFVQIAQENAAQCWIQNFCCLILRFRVKQIKNFKYVVFWFHLKWFVVKSGHNINASCKTIHFDVSMLCFKFMMLIEIFTWSDIRISGFISNIFSEKYIEISQSLIDSKLKVSIQVKSWNNWLCFFKVLNALQLKLHVSQVYITSSCTIFLCFLISPLTLDV